MIGKSSGEWGCCGGCFLCCGCSLVTGPVVIERNRRLTYAQYAGLVLVGLFNPVLTSGRSLVAASGLKTVRRLTGGGRVSLGSFSEASSVFEPRRLEGIAAQLRTKWHRQRGRRLPRGKLGDVPDTLVERLIAIDGTVFTALPKLAADSDRLRQWRLHVALDVTDRTVHSARLSEEPSSPGDSEPTQAAAMIREHPTPGLYLLDRGYRSVRLLNSVHEAGGDYITRLNRNDGRVVNNDSMNLNKPSAAAREIGIVADEWIEFGGSRKASSNHPIRRITVIPPADRPSAARQGRPRTDQTGRDELILATTLIDQPAERIVAMYEQRWQIELFFRFLKHTLGCRTLISAKTAGVEIQLYCAIIASLLLALATGRSLTLREHEMVCHYFSGWANEQELLQTLEKPPP
ncbi:Transposase DDE domain protein [Calycomorphotria hydatis]|uniref:Transposase DDE domain protein n=1 Tax=Calycomorphotria hydatis TaxID=2528027 RepID=A0A517T507_9PLAN|nr:Transposase DDE domain protein [Calycomorphotria hydatis]